MGDGAVPPPSAATLAYFEEPCDLWVAVDIETHELVPPSKDYFWVTGQYGHSCRIDADAISNLRVVQLGLCVGSFASHGPPRVTRHMVRPDGFSISAQAAAKHNITNNNAEAEGKPLREVLEFMLTEVLAVFQRGGRMCAHQLEFDAGVIAMELRRAGLGDKVDAWSQIASGGFCTMSPMVTKWACAVLFDQTGNDSFLGRARPVGLKDLVRALLPGSRNLLERHHDAGADAHMDWLVLRELYVRARRRTLA